MHSTSSHSTLKPEQNHFKMDIPSVYDHPQPENTPTTEPNTTNKNSTQDTQPPPDQATPSSIESSAQTITELPTNAEPTSSNPISLDQELIDLKKTLGGVSASLGGWWGKVQKQSAEALAATNITAQINTARKDLASLNLIEKAKKEVERLGDQAKEGYAVISSEIEKGPDLESTEGRIVNVDGVELPAPSRAISASSSSNTITKDNNQGPTSPKGKERAPDQNQATDDSNPLSPNPLSTFDSGSIGSFFSKLTKDSESLTATIQSKISHLPNPAHVPARLTSSGKFDLSEVQKLAEGYLAKGEVYLQDVGKELKDFVQDAVKVIPPSELESVDQTEEGANNTSAVGVAEKRRILDVKREAMLSKLRRDESQLLADPRDEDESLQSAFDEFLAGVQHAGGFEGEAWKKRIQSELELEDSDQSALKGLLEKLVPSSMTDETFWTRYFFRIHRIDQEEAARRVVLSAAQEDNEGDFSWDMEDESEPPSPMVIIKSGKETSGRVVEGGKTERAEEVETPKLSNLSNPKIDSATAGKKEEPAPGEDEWGNSPVDGTDVPVVKPATSSGTTKSSSTSNNEARRNSASEPDTNDSFDVVSSHQSSDEKPKESTVAPADTNKHDDDEDSDWE
ncbi:hypothetical protein PGT21_034959 [Puccinia graminis f. sp. tritici]|uniref:BSD domain-containing protein n=2 Tax=Puccinia graminis f. sp. tritici TaxID=56615 RepID=E3L4U7_PUCGT|nr:uncharacterized protein PGTG_17626 [Puccinia graminis f. sp. tritici CRL 75-36-700-3]EFP91572.2 hypothetical protein PGTG_17626 [Puccinia graminis f. sp. tritici CRL 75-36-700-3]KAA1075417.1 hypothetical protein PGT21_034959 [Puccinia graminis f. sp. tritici]